MTDSRPSGARRRILVVSHEASRTGAPRVAVLVSESLIGRGHDVTIVLRRPGALEDEFAALAPTRIEAFYRVRRRLWRRRGVRWIALAVDTLCAAATIARTRPEVVYLNSTACAAYVRPALWMRRRVVMHSHESAEVANRFLGPCHAGELLRHTRLVACSPSVRHDLAELCGLDESEIAMVPSVPDSASVRSLATEPLDRSIASDEIVIGCCGSVESRKGPDLWLAVERRVRATLPDAPLRFLWVGTIDDPGLVAPLDPTVFVGPAANPYPYVARFDIATLPSRDDPFPLVVLEAMTLGKPVVAFAVGGVSEQVGPGGVMVDPGDVAAFAAAVASLVADESSRLAMGVRARERVDSLYSVDRFRSAIAHVVEAGDGVT